MTDERAAGSQAGPVPVPLLTPQFILLLFATAAFGLSFSAYFLLPKFLSVRLGADSATIGGISAVSMLASVVAMPFVGVQVDRRGRKLFGVLGAAFFAVAATGFLFVDHVGPLLWILRIIQGATFTLFYISLSTLATDIAPAERLGQAIGMFGAVMISTNALGPALAEWTALHHGWSVVFAGTVVAACVAVVLTVSITEQKKPAHSRDTDASMISMVRRPGFPRVLGAAILVGWTLGALFTFHQPWAISRGLEHVSSFLIAFAVFAMFVRVGLGGLADRMGRLRVATASLVLYVAAPLSLIGIDVFGLFVSGALLGLAHGMFFPALNAVAVDFAAHDERGKAMAAYHGSFNVGFAAGSYFLGYIAMATSYPTIFVIAGATCLMALLVLATTPKARGRSFR